MCSVLCVIVSLFLGCDLFLCFVVFVVVVDYLCVGVVIVFFDFYFYNNLK